jgi:hypothetical protein
VARGRQRCRKQVFELSGSGACCPQRRQPGWNPISVALTVSGTIQYTMVLLHCLAASTNARLLPAVLGRALLIDISALLIVRNPDLNVAPFQPE